MGQRYNANPNELAISADRPHCSRYYLARGFINPDERVIDAGCGSGYGAFILGVVAKEVLGIDKDDIFAKVWCRDNINFMVSDLEEMIEYPKADVYVALEVIEHLKDPLNFLNKITDACFKKIIISSPNKETAGLNPFHLSNVLLVQLRKLMNNFSDWIEYHSFLQGDYYIVIYVKKGTILTK